MLEQDEEREEEEEVRRLKECRELDSASKREILNRYRYREISVIHSVDRSYQ